MFTIVWVAAALAGALDYGVALEVGSKDFRGVSTIAADLGTLEARYWIDPLNSVDLRADAFQWFFSRTLTSNPRLPLYALYHTRLPLSRRFDLSAGLGLDTAVGRDAVVRDEALAWRLGGRLAGTAKLGITRRGRYYRSSWGIAWRPSRGYTWSNGEAAPYRRGVLEVSAAWRLWSPK